MVVCVGEFGARPVSCATRPPASPAATTGRKRSAALVAGAAFAADK